MRPDSKETIDELLNVAERLFAKHGIEQVAMTRIVATSRQRNRSALHYHFGSREGVLLSVLDRRVKAVDALRREMLNDPENSGSTLSGAVRAVVAPFCLVTLNEPWGSDYVGIVAQICAHPRLLGGVSLEEQHPPSLLQCRRLIEQALPKIAPAKLAQRFQWLADSVVLAVARWSRITPKSKRTAEAIDALIEELTAYGAAGIAAPSTNNPVSRSELRLMKARKPHLKGINDARHTPIQR
jgi:AcrR family transcriptional regulator